MNLQDADRPETHLTVKKIFVSGIKDEIETEDLREYFSQLGEIIDVDIIMDKDTKRKRGFAFVQFDDYDPVDKAVREYILLEIMNATDAEQRTLMTTLRQRRNK